MSATGNGSTTYLDTYPSTISPLVSAYSWNFWYNASAAAANTSPNKHAFTLINTAGSIPTRYTVSFVWQHSDATVWKSAIHEDSTGAFAKAQLPITPANGVWINLGATFDGATLTIFYNGIAANSVAANAPSGTAGDPNMGVQAYNNGAANFDNSPMAELAVWSTVLSAAEMLALSRGRSPSNVQFGNIVWYNKLNSTTSDVGPNLTNHGATLNTTYFQEMTGGVALGGVNTTVASKYGWIPSGGIALGGNAMKGSTHFNHRMSGGLAIGGNQVVTHTDYRWTPTGGIALGGNQTSTKSVYHHRMSGGIALGGKRGFPVIQPVGSGAVIVDTGREPAYTTQVK